MRKEFESKLIMANLVRMEMDNNTAILEFTDEDGILRIKEELDLVDTHQLFRFSMFLESFHVKNLDKARQHLNIFIKHKIKIGLMLDRYNQIIYSNMLEPSELSKFKKFILLTKLIRDKKISREMYEEMQDMTYEEIKGVIK